MRRGYPPVNNCSAIIERATQNGVQTGCTPETKNSEQKTARSSERRFLFNGMGFRLVVHENVRFESDIDHFVFLVYIVDCFLHVVEVVEVEVGFGEFLREDFLGFVE